MTTKFNIGETVYVPYTVRRINIDSRVLNDGEIFENEPTYTLELDDEKSLYLAEKKIFKAEDLAFILSPLLQNPVEKGDKK